MTNWGRKADELDVDSNNTQVIIHSPTTTIKSYSLLLTNTRGHNTPRLSLNIRKVTIVINNDVASLSSSLGSNNTLGRNDLSSEGGLVLVGVDLDGGVVMVGGVFEEVLLQVEGGSVGFCCVKGCVDRFVG